MSSTPAPGPTDVATPAISSTDVPAEPHRHAHVEVSRLPMWVAVALTVVSGALTAVQSRINGELARRLDDFAVAAVISFGSGLLILLVVVAAWPAGRRGVGRVREALADRRLAWWMLLGGLAGAWFVATQGIAAAVLGVALFTVAIVAGQTLGGVVVDVIGIGPGGRRPLTLPRAAAAILALAAVGWAVSAQVETAVPVLLLLLPFSAGFAVSWQQAMNGRVRVAASSALAATLVNFAVGTTALVVVLAVHATSVGWPDSMPTEPWLYAGGAVGCVFIAMQAGLVRRVGVLVLGVVAGQLSAALALDLLLPTSDHAVGIATVGGTVLALAAVALSGIRRRARHASPEAVRPVR